MALSLLTSWTSSTLRFLKYRKKAFLKARKKVGIVFNLDEHYKPGSHWVSLYMDTAHGTCYFFDSCGKPPEYRIRKLIRIFARLMVASGIDPVVKINKVVHQTGSTECGVYALYFLVTMLEGGCFDKVFGSTRIPDSIINEYRQVYFN